MGDGVEAMVACRQALTIRTKLANDFPTVPEHRYDLAQSDNNMGILLLDLGKHEEALAAFREALVISEGLVKEFPTVPNYQSDFVRFSGNLAALLSRFGRYEEAEKLCRQHVNQWPHSPDAHNGLAWFLATCPDLKFRKVAEAVTLAKRAVQVSPDNGGYWNTLGVAQYQARDCQAALEALQKSMQLSNGGDSNDWFFLAMAHWQLGDKEQARKWYDQAVQWMAKNQPQNDELRCFRDEAAELLGIKPPPLTKTRTRSKTYSIADPTTNPI
jgi:tetratricopeptide (TPR) repeat protein